MRMLRHRLVNRRIAIVAITVTVIFTAHFVGTTSLRQAASGQRTAAMKAERTPAEQSFHDYYSEFRYFKSNPAALAKMKTDYLAGYKQGQQEAERELKEGRPTIYTYGLPLGFENRDPETGLPYRGIAGCMVNHHVVGRGAGHDDRIMTSIEKRHQPRESPRESLTASEYELFNLKDFVDAR
jgi:hypothetical protein